MNYQTLAAFALGVIVQSLLTIGFCIVEDWQANRRNKDQ